MTNYGYPCYNWTYTEKQILAKALETIWTDIEIDQLYEGVRLRRLPKSWDKINDIVRRADTISILIEHDIGKSAVNESGFIEDVSL
jgi:hypothetical protein